MARRGDTEIPLGDMARTCDTNRAVWTVELIAVKIVSVILGSLISTLVALCTMS